MCDGLSLLLKYYTQEDADENYSCAQVVDGNVKIEFKDLLWNRAAGVYRKVL